jgi:hypothetical protein
MGLKPEIDVLNRYGEMKIGWYRWFGFALVSVRTRILIQHFRSMQIRMLIQIRI